MTIYVPAPPAPQPPVEQVQKQNQDQNQNQTQDQDNTTNIGKLDQNQSTKSDADSTADSTSSQSSVLQNTQINQNSNRLEYGTFKVPETTLTLSGIVNGGGDREDNYSVVLGLNVPLGGGMRKTVKSALDTQLKADVLSFERSYASVCANLDGESYSVTNASGNLNLLKSCRTDLVKRTTLPTTTTPPVITPPVVVTPPVNSNSEIEELKRQNTELRLMIAQLAEKLDNNKPVPGGY